MDDVYGWAATNSRGRILIDTVGATRADAQRLWVRRYSADRPYIPVTASEADIDREWQSHRTPGIDLVEVAVGPRHVGRAIR